MNLEEFRRLAETWGSDIARWPEALREDAARLAKEPEAAAILADALAFDRIIAGSAPEVSNVRAAQAINRVVTQLAAGRTAAPRLRLFDMTRWLAPAASFAAAATFGFYLGAVYPAYPPQADSAARFVLVTLIGGDAFGLEWLQ